MIRGGEGGGGGVIKGAKTRFSYIWTRKE